MEAGERLGFLPGTLSEKIDPYLRPLYDALHDMMDAETDPEADERGVIEVAPLAYMRGRTLNDAVHHPRRGAEHDRRADEDVPDPARASAPRSSSPATSRRSTCPAAHVGAAGRAATVLDDIDDIHFAELTSADVVRHRLVSDIVDAYAEVRGRQPGRINRSQRRAAVRPGR